MMEKAAIAYKLTVIGTTEDVEWWCSSAAGENGCKTHPDTGATIYRFSPLYYPTLTNIDRHPAVQYAWGWTMHEQGAMRAQSYWQWNDAGANGAVWTWFREMQKHWHELKFCLRWQLCEQAWRGVMGDEHPSTWYASQVDPFPYVRSFPPLLDENTMQQIDPQRQLL